MRASPASPPPTPPSRRRRGNRLIGWALLLPLPLAAFSFGTVHPGPRGLLAGVLIALALLAVGVAPRSDRDAPGARAVVLPGVVLLALSALSLVPVDADLRSTLQPGLAAAVQGMVDLAGGDRHPLALAPARARGALGMMSALLLFGLAVSITVQSRRRRLRLSMGVVTTGLLVLALEAAQQATGATSILWWSGVPAATRYPFFGPFVSHNHAGAFLAACVPLALGLALRPHREWRVLGAAAAVLLAGGVLAAQTRGGLLSLGVGAGVFVAVAFGRRAAALVGASGLVLAVAALAGGIRHAATVFSESLVPGALDQDVFGNRLVLWEETLSLIRAAPWVGVGPGGFADGYKLVKASPAFMLSDHAHHEVLQVVAEHGVIVGLGWVALAIVPVGYALRRLGSLDVGRRRGQQAAWLACYAAVLVGALYDFPLKIGALALLCVIAGAVLLAGGGRGAGASDAAPSGRTWALAVPLAVAGLAGVVVPAAAHIGSAPGLATGADGAPGQALWDDARAAHRAGQDPGPALAALASQSQAALARRPLDQAAAVWLIRARLASDDAGGARAAAERLTTAYPTLPAGWFLLAAVCRQEGDAVGARAAWRAGLASDLPDLDQSVPYIRRALSQESDPVAAADAILPERGDRLRDGAVLLAQAGGEAKARELFERALALDPTTGESYANWLLLWDEPERAVAVLKRSGTPSCRGHLLRGDAHLATGEVEVARTAYRSAMTLCDAPERVEAARLGTLRTRVALGDREAVPLLIAAIEDHPGHHRMRREVLAALRTQGRYEDMVPHIEELVLEGVATPEEQASLSRLYRGLPPR